jgi:hypothetical protein
MAKKQETQFTWGGVHAEAQKFLPKPSSYLERDNDYAYGFDLSLVENKVSFSLQKLLWQHLSQGKCRWLLHRQEETGLYFPFQTPRIELKKADLLRAYGLKKREWVSKATGKTVQEFKSTQARVFWKAFERLTEQRFLVRYRCQEPNPETGELNSVVEYREPLFSYDSEGKFLDFGLVMVHELERYGFPKPIDYLERAELALEKMGISKASKYHIRFLEWLMLRAWQNGGRELSISPEQLVYTLRMYEKYWLSGKKKAAENLIGQGIQMAEEMGYLKAYTEHGGKDGTCFVFNPNNEVLRPKKDKSSGKKARGSKTG